MSNRISRLAQLTSECNQTQSGLARECQDFAECNGFVMRRRDATNKLYMGMGMMTVLPSRFPKNVYQQVIDCQPYYNELYHKIAHDYDFMKEALSSTIEGDEFIKRFWEIYEATRNNADHQTVSLGLLRSDYMYQCNQNGSFIGKQIEMNTIASSMAGLSTSCQKTHRYLAKLHPSLIDVNKLPLNDSLVVLATGIYKAWQAYNSPQAVVLFIVHEGEGNFADIRQLQYQISELNHTVQVNYAGFATLNECARLDSNNKLFVNGSEVGVVYYRYGYAPDHYPTEDQWTLRLNIEKSRAIKCPSINYHLAGSKKIQQELTRPGMVERFLDRHKSAAVRKTFVGIYSLAKGGDFHEGNNYYGADIATKWAEIKDTPARESYILMERIIPPSQINCCVPCEPQCKCMPMISELGIYGAILGDATTISHNETAGYLLRTKGVNTDEGGIMVGRACIDTPELVTDSDMITEIDCCKAAGCNCP